MNVIFSTWLEVLFHPISIEPSEAMHLNETRYNCCFASANTTILGLHDIKFD